MPYQKYAEIERKHNRPMADILFDMLTEHGREKTAELLGVDSSTVWIWAHRAGLRHECRWVRETASANRSA